MQISLDCTISLLSQPIITRMRMKINKLLKSRIYQSSVTLFSYTHVKYTGNFLSEQFNAVCILVDRMSTRLLTCAVRLNGCCDLNLQENLVFRRHKLYTFWRVTKLRSLTAQTKVHLSSFFNVFCDFCQTLLLHHVFPLKRTFSLKTLRMSPDFLVIEFFKAF